MCVSSLTSISHIPHSVFEGPDDRVQHKFELGRGYGEECREAVRVYSLEQVEEVGPVFWKLLKVLAEKHNMFTPTIEFELLHMGPINSMFTSQNRHFGRVVPLVYCFRLIFFSCSLLLLCSLYSPDETRSELLSVITMGSNEFNKL